MGGRLSIRQMKRQQVERLLSGIADVLVESADLSISETATKSAGGLPWRLSDALRELVEDELIGEDED